MYRLHNILQFAGLSKDEYDEIFPGYDFAKNKGYGTAAHIEGLKKLGPCDIHRFSFIHNYI